MASKDINLTSLPLNGPLNLSQNKLDVTAPGESGFLKNNGVLYGETLSPVYREATGYNSEYYDKDGNRWDITSTNITRNGTPKMSFNANVVRKEKLNLDNVVAYGSNDSYIRWDASLQRIYIKLPNDESESSVHFSHELLSARLITGIPDLCVLMYINSTSGKYYFAIWNNEEELENYELGFGNTSSPLLTVHKVDSDSFLVSAFSDSGANFSGSVLTFMVSRNTLLGASWHISPCDFASSVSTSQSIETSTTYFFKDFFINRYPSFNINKVSTGMGTYNLYTQQEYQIGFDGKVPGSMKIYLYWQPTMTASSNPESDHYLIKTSSYDEIFSTAINTANIDTTYLANKSSISWDDIFQSGSTIQTNKSYYIGTIENQNDKVSINVNMQGSWLLAAPYTIADYEPFMFFMDSTNTDKKALGFLWCKIQYVDNGITKTHNFKFLPETQDEPKEWMNGFDNVTLVKTDGSTNTRAYFDDFSISKTTTITDVPTALCDAILDNGTLICTKAPATETDVETGLQKYVRGLFGFTGTITSIIDNPEITGHKLINYASTSSNTFYVGLVEDTENPYPYFFVTRQCSLDKDYFRYNLISEGFFTEEEKKQELNILYDTGFNKVFWGTGYNNATKTLGSGSVAAYGNWRVLYNNNIVTNISIAENNTNTGTLLMDWNSIQDILFASSSMIVVQDIYGNILKFYTSALEAEESKPYTIIMDRYIVVNTYSYWNCYDMKTGKRIHYATDWNNRWMNGNEVADFFKANTDNNNIFNQTSILNTAIQGTGSNANYEVTNNPISGIILPPEVVSTVVNNETPYILMASHSADTIDVYFTAGETVAVYETTWTNKVFVADNNMFNVYLPTEVRYNPNLFTKYVKTYSFNDMIINDTTAYQLTKYNGNYFLNFTMTGGLENAESVFVIQTLVYFIADDKIWEANYSNGTLASVSAIAAIKGMTYLGTLPTQSLFWDPVSRSIFSFAGDAILRKVAECNEISTIKGTWYRECNQELFIATDVGLLCISDTYQYLLTEYKNVSAMFFYGNIAIVKNTVHSQGTYITTDYQLSYQHSDTNSTNLVIKTKWLGDIANQVLRVDCFYIRLFLDKTFDNSKSVTFKSETITDIGTESDTKTISLTVNDFDSVTKSVYLRYQPQYQTAVAMNFTVTTPFPIISMSVGYTVKDEQPQISHINI